MTLDITKATIGTEIVKQAPALFGLIILVWLFLGHIEMNQTRTETLVYSVIEEQKLNGEVLKEAVSALGESTALLKLYREELNYQRKER